MEGQGEHGLSTLVLCHKPFVQQEDLLIIVFSALFTLTTSTILLHSVQWTGITLQAGGSNRVKFYFLFVLMLGVTLHQAATGRGNWNLFYLFIIYYYVFI